MSKKSKLCIFAGSSGQHLVEPICKNLGIRQGKVKVGKFNNGEIQIQFGQNVRGTTSIVLQSVCGGPENSPSDDLMEGVLMVDALRRASAREIIFVMPHYGFARQDQKKTGRVPISAKVVADLLEASGVDKLIIVDLHAGQVQGFFNIPVDNVYASPVLVPHIAQNYSLKKLVIVSPDMGGAERARSYAKHFGVEVAIIDKRRPRAGVSEVMNIVGNVKDKNCIIVDDMADTCGTLVNGAAALMENGAKKVDAYCAHPVLSNGAHKLIEKSAIRKLVVTDTIPLSKAAKKCKKIEVVSLADFLSKVIKRNEKGKSVSKLFI